MSLPWEAEHPFWQRSIDSVVTKGHCRLAVFSTATAIPVEVKSADFNSLLNDPGTSFNAHPRSVGVSRKVNVVEWPLPLLPMPTGCCYGKRRLFSTVKFPFLPHESELKNGRIRVENQAGCGLSADENESN
jgi:hypothetical protein